jgi:hypothetical protein
MEALLDLPWLPPGLGLGAWRFQPPATQRFGGQTGTTLDVGGVTTGNLEEPKWRSSAAADSLAPGKRSYRRRLTNSIPNSPTDSSPKATLPSGTLRLTPSSAVARSTQLP